MSVAQPPVWILMPLNPKPHYVPLVPEIVMLPTFPWVCIQSPWASFPTAVGPLHPQQTDWRPFLQPFIQQYENSCIVSSPVSDSGVRRTGVRSMVAQTAFQDGGTIAAYRGGPVQESADNNNDRDVHEKNELTVTVVQDTRDDMNVYFRSGINLNVEP